ncbi:MAG TPA: hypothetical protein PLT68_00035 [Actinomycetota bacterium]|nr:hypothetical protein [Actinomycetota bacterium]
MIGALAVAGTLVFSGVGPGLPIPAEAFGMHVADLAQTAPADAGLTAVRLWDSGVRWDQIETSRDVYEWSALDTAVDNARAAGATDILYVLGSTPRWAARNPGAPGLYGPGTTSLPADPEDYLDFTREVARRYQGRITGYQIWNEANTRSFYEGDWTALARLTRRAYDAVKITDPAAYVVSASSTVIPGGLFQTESFFVRYARALHQMGDPVDAMAVHLYPVDTSSGPQARTRSIRAAQRVLNRVGINRPLWDTEVNYGDRRPGLPTVVPDPDTAAAYVARTYLDAATMGIARTYWYGWDLDVLGIDLTDSTGITTAGRAFLTVRDWLVGARIAGCQQVGGVRRCHFTSPGGDPFTVAWTPDGTATLDVAGLEVCRLDGRCTTDEQDLLVGIQPVLLRARDG